MLGLLHQVDLFDQLLATPEDVWVAVAMLDEKAWEIIDEVPKQPPLEMRYDKLNPVDWASCSTALDAQSQIDVLVKGWSGFIVTIARAVACGRGGGGG